MHRRAQAALVAFVAVTVGFGVHSRSRAASVPITHDGHMDMTLHAALKPGDRERGDAILAAARDAMIKYANVEDAERDGFKKFLPNIPLPEEHYTSRTNAIEAQFAFDPAKPTSIIYKRTATGLVVDGVMYTAPNRATEAQLDARVPLSLGTWHRHVDFCRGPAGSFGDTRFGFSGSIETKDACEAAGGHFIPLVFGWMVHVWPKNTDPSKIWAVDADEEHGMGGMHHHHAEGMIADQNTLPIPLAKLPAAPVAAGDATRGAEIFAGNCASCHGAGGANGPDAPKLLGSGLTAGQVAFMVRNPRAIDPASDMPNLGLADRDVADVAAYVAGLSK